jgi:ribose/xylose/arabinose/galactoside ABC-type transport system permease subunit
MRFAGEIGLGIAALVLAATLLFVGRRSSGALARSSLAFALYPSMILVLVAFGMALLIASGQ